MFWDLTSPAVFVRSVARITLYLSWTRNFLLTRHLESNSNFFSQRHIFSSLNTALPFLARQCSFSSFQVPSTPVLLYFIVNTTALLFPTLGLSRFIVIFHLTHTPLLSHPTPSQLTTTTYTSTWRQADDPNLPLYTQLSHPYIE